MQHRASLVAQRVKNLPAKQETWVSSLDQEDPLAKGTITPSVLAWRIPRTEEAGRLQSMGSQRVRCDWVTNTLASLSHGVCTPLVLTYLRLLGQGKLLPCLQPNKILTTKSEGFGNNVAKHNPTQEDYGKYLTSYISLLSQLPLLELTHDPLMLHSVRPLRCWLLRLPDSFPHHLIPTHHFRCCYLRRGLHFGKCILSYATMSLKTIKCSVFSALHRWGGGGSQRVLKWLNQGDQASWVTSPALRLQRSDIKAGYFPPINKS